MYPALPWTMWTLGGCLLLGGACLTLIEVLHPYAGYDRAQTALLAGIGLLLASRMPPINSRTDPPAGGALSPARCRTAG